MSLDYSHIWNKALYDIFMYFDIEKDNDLSEHLLKKP